MASLVERIWNTSPASLARAIQRRARERRQQPGWFTIKAGPVAGANLYLPNDSEGAWQEMVAGTFDDFLYATLKAQRELKGAVCWDIGAHFGYHTLGFAALGAQVVAFEPNRLNAERLKLHLERNPALAARIRCVEAAVSDRDGQMTFVQSGDMGGQSSGSHLAEALPPLEAAAYNNFERLTVPAVRMDTLIARGEPAPDVLKIDVEGGEYLALEGGRRLLAERKPLLLMEVHHICLMLRIQELLLGLGYTTRILDEQHAAPSRCFIIGVAS